MEPGGGGLRRPALTNCLVPVRARNTTVVTVLPRRRTRSYEYWPGTWRWWRGGWEGGGPRVGGG